MKTRQVTIRISDDLMKKLEHLAELDENKVKQVVIDAVNFYLELDPGFIGGLEEFYTNTGCKSSLPMILQRLAVMHLAERNAEIDLGGVPKHLFEADNDGLDVKRFYSTRYDNLIRQGKAEEEARKSREHLDKYLQLNPEGQALYEQDRDKALADFLEKYPDKKDEIEKAIARQKEYETKRKHKK